MQKRWWISSTCSFPRRNFWEEGFQDPGIARRDPANVRNIGVPEGRPGHLDDVRKRSQDSVSIGRLLRDGKTRGSESYKGVESAGRKA